LAEAKPKTGRAGIRPISPTGAVLAYLLIGAPVGGAVVLAAMLWRFGPSGSPLTWRDASEIAAAAFTVLAASYISGGVPAVVTGAVMGLFSSRRPTAVHLLVANILVGAGASALWGWAFAAFTDMDLLPTLLVWLSVLGALAGLSCGAFALWFWRK
jgi:hypothetical protein